MNYNKIYTLNKNRGNNGLSYEERRKYFGKEPELTIPSLKTGILDDISMGDTIVFEEVENGSVKSCKGLKHFVQLKDSRIPITIFDNHNHALYFWIEAMQLGIIQPGFELIHIDEHSDLWPNENHLDADQALKNLEYAWEFTNFSCNVGNYIEPALASGLIGKMIRIENEYQIDEYMQYSPQKNSVLNVDLDIFAPEMDFIDEAKKIKLIRELVPKVNCITIATSPYFIEPGRALEKLHLILKG